MKPTPTPSKQIPQFDHEAAVLKKKLQAMSQKQLKSHFKLSDKLSAALFKNIHPWQETHRAVEAYQGQQFKALDVGSLHSAAQAYLEERLTILSGLYGPLKPNDRIAIYRAPLDEGLPQTSLVAFWQKRLNAYFTKDVWVNCASAEYAQLLPKTDNCIAVDFVELKGTRLTRPSMTLKTMRGLFVRFAALEQAETIEDLKAFQAEGFTLHEATDNRLQFIKKNSVL